jgi:putative ABC transport system permease protein
MTRLSLFVIRLLTPAAEREWVVGDTVEEFRRRERHDGARAARRWLRREMWGLVAGAARFRWTIRSRTVAQPRRVVGRDHLFRSIYTDATLAVRRWIARPALALTAILTLGVGIGAATAIFSVVDGVLLRPLPWREPERLVFVYTLSPALRTDPVLRAFWDRGPFTWPQFTELQRPVPAVEAVASWMNTRVTIGGDTAGGESAALVDALHVSSAMLPMLGVRTFAGRTFSAAEERAVSDSVLISYEAWQRRLGGDAAVLGRRVVLNDAGRTIVGVLPPGFVAQLGSGGELPLRPDFLLPFGALGDNRRPSNGAYRVVARLAPGASLLDAEAQLTPLLSGGKDTQPAVRVVPLIDEQFGRSRESLYVLLAGALLLVMIACANVAGLLLGDGSTRRHEFAMRRALGAGRAPVLRQLLTESSVLALGGGAIGVALAWWIMPALVALAPEGLPRIDTVAVDLRVLAFAVAITAATTLVCGVGPSLVGSAAPAADVLRDGQRAGRRRRWTPRAIVIGEVALATVLLCSAALLTETVLRLRSQPVGFNPDGVLALGVQIPREDAADVTRRTRIEASVLDRIRRVPGVASAAAVAAPPFSGITGFNGIGVEGRPGEVLRARRHLVTGEYFATMGIPILRGRGFQAADASWQQTTQPPPDSPITDGAGVAIVSEETERRYFGGTAVGRRMVFGRTRLTVVGVVGDVKMGRYSEDATPEFYLFTRQFPWIPVGHVVVRAADDAPALLPALRRAATTNDSHLAVTSIGTLDDAMSRTVANERYRAVLSVAFGGTAIFLAAICLFGLLSRTVNERRREIGVRMAVGATPADIVRLVIGEGSALAVAGLLLGLPAAAGVARIIQAQLFGVQPSAPHTFVLASLVLGTAVCVAMLIVARHASRVHPLAALRTS